MAKKMQPGVAKRESKTGALDTNKSLSQCSSPPTNNAISPAVNVIISCPRLHEQALRDHQMAGFPLRFPALFHDLFQG